VAPAVQRPAAVPLAAGFSFGGFHALAEFFLGLLAAAPQGPQVLVGGGSGLGGVRQAGRAGMGGLGCFIAHAPMVPPGPGEAKIRTHPKSAAYPGRQGPAVLSRKAGLKGGRKPGRFMPGLSVAGGGEGTGLRFLLPLLQGRSSLKWSIAEDPGGA
jgi:hypothetical protein